MRSKARNKAISKGGHWGGMDDAKGGDVVGHGVWGGRGAGLRAGAMPTACRAAGAQVGRGSTEEISLVGEIVTAACLCFMHKVSLCFIYTLGDLERPIS